MYELKIITDFAAAHRLENFCGKCEGLHGHNWKVEVFLLGDRLDDAGLVKDFGIVKDRTREVLAELDHRYLNELPAFQSQNPSSENLARTIYGEMKGLPGLAYVEVWESPESRARFIP